MRWTRWRNTCHVSDRFPQQSWVSAVPGCLVSWVSGVQAGYWMSWVSGVLDVGCPVCQSGALGNLCPGCSGCRMSRVSAVRRCFWCQMSWVSAVRRCFWCQMSWVSAVRVVLGVGCPICFLGVSLVLDLVGVSWSGCIWWMSWVSAFFYGVLGVGSHGHKLLWVSFVSDLYSGCPWCRMSWVPAVLGVLGVGRSVHQVSLVSSVLYVGRVVRMDDVQDGCCRHSCSELCFMDTATRWAFH